MRRKFAIKALALLLLAAVTVLAMAPLRCPRASAGEWMAQLDDGRRISTLSLPGTHDSGARYSFAGVFGKCQTLGIGDQLELGVRFFDLRLRLVDNRLRVYHNFVEQKASFRQVLDTLVTYLQENPREFLLVSLKEEEAPLRSDRVFSQALEQALEQYPQVVCAADTLPETVGEARGKLYILARYEGATMGIPCAGGWVNNSAFALGEMYIQDHYKLDKPEEKMPDITQAFAEAASGSYSLVLNYTSCYLSSGFPPSYAGTPAHTVNPWLLEQLEEGEGPTGVVICDFITSELSGAIIGRNFS